MVNQVSESSYTPHDNGQGVDQLISDLLVRYFPGARRHGSFHQNLHQFHLQYL